MVIPPEPPAEPRDPEEELYTQCTLGGPVIVHVKNKKIVRVRPLPLTEEDVKEAHWKITVGEKTFEPPTRTTVTPYGLGFRGHVYNPLRLKYPMKRVGFEPGGKSSVENRGKGEFVQISWDEALETVAQEITRIKETYGPDAILPRPGGHSMWGFTHLGLTARFFNILGSQRSLGHANSWEGWFWGGVHAWGFHENIGNPDQSNLLEDIMKNCQLLVFWSNDPESNWGYGGQESLLWRLWLRELGIKQIFIDPFCNFTARRFAHKWIAPRPGTDTALAAAIAYIWFIDDTYDKDYVATHTYGFDKWKEYILGDEDGVPKTPDWAEQISGVEAGIIRALAREWASKRTTICVRAGMGGACRAQGGTEWARMMILLQAMQGLGKPGVSIWDSQSGPPLDVEFFVPTYRPSPVDLVAKTHPVNQAKGEGILGLRIPEAILSPPVQWTGAAMAAQGPESQFVKYNYPKPGQSEIKLIYRIGGNFFGTLPEGSRWAQAYQSPKVEFIVGQTAWMEAETPFMDIVLPACTPFETVDISEWSSADFNIWRTNHRVIVYHQKCIDPLYESKTDMEIMTLLADKLGFEEELTEGNTAEDWVRKAFEISDITKYMSYEEFKKKGYFIVPISKDYQQRTAFRSFYETGTGLGTPSGKIEFSSQRLQKYLPDDEERPLVPKYVPSWEGHTVPLTQKYPLQLITPHAKFSYHSHSEQDPWIRSIWMHRRLKEDGYQYWPIQIHPTDASARGIKDGDIVRAYNDRAAVLLVAWVTEKIRPGVVHARMAAKYDPVEPGNPHSIDRGGAVNLLMSARFLSTNVPGQVAQGLVEVEKWGGK